MQLNEYLSDSQKRRKRRRRDLRMVAGIVAVALVIIGIVWIIVRSPIFHVDHITVSGNSAVPSDEIVSLAQMDFAQHGSPKFLGIANILAWPTSFTSSELALEPQISNATIGKDYFSHTIAVSVTERQPFGIWCLMSSSNQAMTDASSSANPNERCYWFDDSGFIFAKGFDTQGSLLFTVHDYSQAGLHLEGNVLPSELVPNLISVLNAVRASGISIQEIRLNDISLQELQVVANEGPSIYYSLQFSADDTVPVLKSLMSQPGFDNLGYVDFRTQNRVYYE